MNRIQIKARGFTFDALSDGSEDGPLLILLHGLPRTSWEWHHQLPKLAEAGFRVIALDLRGYCPGARPEGVKSYVVDEFVQDILAIADQLGWTDRPFHLMATSIGSVIAILIADITIKNILERNEKKYIPLLFYDDLQECMLLNLKYLEENEKILLSPSRLIENKIITIINSKNNTGNFKNVNTWWQDFNNIKPNLFLKEMLQSPY